MAEEIERIYVIPLKKKGFKSSSSAPSAVKRVKNFLTRHMKAEEENIWIDDSLNNAIWAQGKYRMPGKIRVKAVKFEDGVVEAYLPELEFKKSRRELLKEEREKKEPILKKEEEVGVEEEAVGVPGAEEYDISPTVDGEVKIKKKRAPKKKEEEKKPIKKPKKTKKPSKKEKKEMKEEEKTSKSKKEGEKTKSKTTKKSASKSKTKKKISSKSAKKKSE